MSSEVTLPTLVRNEIAPLSANQMQARVNLIQQVMKKVMKENTHYGVIPGTPKPSLYKPGAEVLRVTFNLAATIKEAMTIELSGGHREERVTISIADFSGRVIAEGIGSCSTLESKYRYRRGEGESTGRAVPSGYWDAKRAGNLALMQEMLGGKGFSPKKVDGAWVIFKAGEGKTENPDPADCYNTILKMAKKRAFVDAILTATGASDIFTQDIEDLGTDSDDTPAAPEQPKQAAMPSMPAHKEPEFVQQRLHYYNLSTVPEAVKDATIQLFIEQGAEQDPETYLYVTEGPIKIQGAERYEVQPPAKEEREIVNEETGEVVTESVMAEATRARINNVKKGKKAA